MKLIIAVLLLTVSLAGWTVAKTQKMKAKGMSYFLEKLAKQYADAGYKVIFMEPK